MTEVPNVDDRIERCHRLVGEAHVRCWAELDQFLMEEVVPWVPLLVETSVFPLSGRVTDASIDQFTGYPSLDRIALVPGSD